MSRFAKVTAALEALPEGRKEEIAAIIETLFHGDLHPDTALSAAQQEDLRCRLLNPGPLASDDEVEAFFVSLAP